MSADNRQWVHWQSLRYAFVLGVSIVVISTLIIKLSLFLLIGPDAWIYIKSIIFIVLQLYVLIVETLHFLRSVK